MNWTPYISGALTAVVFFTVYNLLPRKLKGVKRNLVAIAVTVPAALCVRFVADLLCGI